MKKNLREQMTVAEQKDLLKLIMKGEVTSTLDILNALPSDLKSRVKFSTAKVFERALPSMSYVRKDSEYVAIVETPEQVVERLERAMNNNLRKNHLAYVNASHMKIEKERLQHELNEYIGMGKVDMEHVEIVKNEIRKIEEVINQIYNDCDEMAMEYSEISSIKNKMAEILSEK